MKKKMLVTGLSGFVAGSVIAQAEGDWEVHGVGRAEPPPDTENVKNYGLDLLDSENVRELFQKINPDTVIHTAAIADIDYCEKNQDIADSINVGTTEILTQLCWDSGAKIVFCSTDNVFDGEKGLYVEKDVPKSVNYYGETKIRAEQNVQSMGTDWVIARLSLVMGLPVIGRGNSYLSGMIERFRKGEFERTPENEIRTPIDVITLGKALIELAGNDFSGIVHLAGNSRLTRYEMVRQIAEKMNFSPELIIATNSNEMHGRASRPEDASLDNSRAKDVLETPMLSLLDGLESTLNFRATGTRMRGSK